MEASTYKGDITGVVVTALNILDGMDHRGNWDILQPAWDYEGLGFVEFCVFLADIAGESEIMLEKRKPQDFLGVYDYEVSHELGVYFINHVVGTGKLPSREEAVHQLTLLADRFFAQSQTQPAPISTTY